MSSPHFATAGSARNTRSTPMKRSSRSLVWAPRPTKRSLRGVSLSGRHPLRDRCGQVDLTSHRCPRYRLDLVRRIEGDVHGVVDVAVAGPGELEVAADVPAGAAILAGSPRGVLGAGRGPEVIQVWAHLPPDETGFRINSPARLRVRGGHGGEKSHESGERARQRRLEQA